MKLDPAHVAAYLTHRLAQEAHVLALEPLGETTTTNSARNGLQSLKTYGYGKPVLIRYQLADGCERRAVLRTMAANPFGHERRADRAAGMILSYDSFGELPRHIRALDVGVLADDGRLASVGGKGEFFLLTDYAEGTLYADDLQRLRDGQPLTSRDLARARALARYLGRIHAVRRPDAIAYRRHLRDVFGSGEGIMGLTDSYPADFRLAPAAWLESVERRCLDWRWRIKSQDQRLSQIHGDFHPFNVLFDGETDLWLLDRSRGGWGEPADDVSCMAINYLFFALQRSLNLEPPFTTLWDTFWATYMQQTGDRDLLKVIAPFFAWRALVVASPLWYQVDDAVRAVLFRFVDNLLDAPCFDPARVNEYLQARQV